MCRRWRFRQGASNGPFWGQSIQMLISKGAPVSSLPRHGENRRFCHAREKVFHMKSQLSSAAKRRRETRPGANPDRATFSETKDKVNELEFYIFKSIQ